MVIPVEAGMQTVATRFQTTRPGDSVPAEYARGLCGCQYYLL